MVRRAAQILDVATKQATKLKAKACALAPWAFEEAERQPAKPSPIKPLPAAERRDSGRP